MKVLRDIITFLTILALMAGSFVVGRKYDSFFPSRAGSVFHDAGPVLYISTSELQRRLNKQFPKARLVVDGKCGRETQRWWDRAYGDQIAIELWPEDSSHD